MAEAIPKIFGQITLVAATSADVFESPSTGAAFSVKIVNDSSTTTAKVKLSLSSVTATQDATGRLLPDDHEIAPKGFVTLTGLTIESGKFLVVESDISTDVNAIAYGMQL